MFLRNTLPSCATLSASLLLSAVVLSGCAGSMTSTPTTANAIAVTGNWQISSASATAAKLPVLSGELSGSSAAITGIFHANAASSCMSSKTSFAMTGSADAKNVVTLTAANVAGGTLTLSGTLASDGKSISNASYNVSGGSCAFVSPAQANAQQYASITGTYNGIFIDAGGTPVLNMTAQLTQTPASDTDGNFQLTGTANLGQNPCFTSPTAVASSQVTGGSFTLTYTDSTIGNSVTASGTFSTDGKTLAITSWALTGTCGTDSGTGTLTRQ